MALMAPAISMVVASRNEGHRLQATLEAALAIDPPVGGLEISVVDDASTDNSSAFLDQGHWLELRNQGALRLKRLEKNLGVSSARREGALGSRGNILVFADAHLDFPQKDFWLQLSQRFDSPSCGLLAVDCYDTGGNGTSTAGMVYSSKRLCHTTPAWVPIEQGKPLEMEEVPFVNGGFLAIRRSIYAHLEGFHDCLQGWGHEDRLLSMLAGLLGHKSYSDQRLKVGHFYKSGFETSEEVSIALPCSDPLPADGLTINSPIFEHAQVGAEPVPRLLLNSLRCAVLLYDSHHFAMTVEQLRFDYGPDLVQQALSLLEQEKPQLLAYLERIGLSIDKRDQAFRDFCTRFRARLPMLVEAELQFIAAIPESKQALERIQALPRDLSSLASPEREHYQCARLYREAALHLAASDYANTASLIGELLQIDPNFLPAIRIMTIALHALGRSQGELFWLRHGVAVVDEHRSTSGPGPIDAHHPASSNPYLRNLYWPGVDREFWESLADFEERRGNPAGALPWLARLLEQSPNDLQVLQKLRALTKTETESAIAA